MRLYYAQNKEDLFIKAFFPDVKEGFYIDVGANDPVVDSVTKLLYDEGWSGINIEPIQDHFQALKRARPRDVTVQLGLSSKSGSLDFVEYPEGKGLSTFDESMQKFYESGKHRFKTQHNKKYEVEVKTLQQLINEQQVKHIHVIKIDVEGYEAEVIKGYDWENPRPELICIEANHIHTDWEVVLRKKKYHEVFFDGINKYYLAEESLFRKEYFNYPETVFSGNPVYYPAYVEIESRIAERQRQLIADKEHEIAILHQQQRDVRFLAKRLALETQLRLNKRAKGMVITEHLTYKQNDEVDALIQGTDKEQVLTTTHKLDMQNIQRSRVTVRDRLGPVGWKFAAGAVNTAVRAARKARHGR